MKLISIFKKIFSVEEAVLPIFIHNPTTGAIAGVVLATESTVLDLFGQTAAMASSATSTEASK